MGMKMKVGELAVKFQNFIGDSAITAPEPFICTALNWAFNELPRVPKLGKLFSKHYSVSLDANGHFKWSLNKDFRRLSDILYINFWTSTGGEPCKLNLCHRNVVDFYEKNGLVSIRKAGEPCEYTIEVEGDKVWLVMDRPLNVPIIVDYIACGFPKPVQSFEDEIDISAIAENLIFGMMQTVWHYEGFDYAWSQQTLEYLSNYALEQAIQELNKRWGNESHIILGA